MGSQIGRSKIGFYNQQRRNTVLRKGRKLKSVVDWIFIEEKSSRFTSFLC
jgi:hypothetical protein